MTKGLEAWSKTGGAASNTACVAASKIRELLCTDNVIGGKYFGSSGQSFHGVYWRWQPNTDREEAQAQPCETAPAIAGVLP